MRERDLWEQFYREARELGYGVESAIEHANYRLKHLEHPWVHVNFVDKF